MRSLATFLLSLVAVASANLYITSPTATTIWTAGQNSTVQWQDDGNTPNLQAFGPSKVSIYVGNAIQQTSLQLIVGSVDVSTTNAIEFIPDGTIGPSGADYFIRFESLSLKDATNPQFPALAFSAKFTLNGMTGQFTPQEQSQIDGASTAPLGGSSTPASSLPATTTGTSMTMSSSRLSSTKSSSGASPSSSSNTQKGASNAAVGISVGKFVTGAFAGVVGLAMLF